MTIEEKIRWLQKEVEKKFDVCTNSSKRVIYNWIFKELWKLLSESEQVEPKTTVAEVLAYEAWYNTALNDVISQLNKEKPQTVPYRNGIERGIEISNELIATPSDSKVDEITRCPKCWNWIKRDYDDEYCCECGAKFLPEPVKSEEQGYNERYFLVWEDWWIFSSDNEQDCKNFKDNMINSKRFMKKKTDKLIIVDKLSLWKSATPTE